MRSKIGIASFFYEDVESFSSTAQILKNREGSVPLLLEHLGYLAVSGSNALGPRFDQVFMRCNCFLCKVLCDFDHF